jgi:hypothetical protein
MTSTPEEVGSTLIWEDWLMVMPGAEEVEWYQIHQALGFLHNLHGK